EEASVEALLAAFEARQLAAAVARFFKAGRSAPEDLIEVSLEQRKPRERGNDVIPAETKRPRDSFASSVWISISVGRKQRAEPRWLIPMLCRNGNITKNEIGAIKMQPEETYVELSADASDGFLGALGPNSMLERGISVKVLEGMPDLTPQFYERTPGEKSPRYDRPERRADWKPKGEFEKKPRFEKKREFDRPEGAGAKPHWKDRDDKAASDKKPRFEKKREFDKPEGAGAKPHWKDREDGGKKPAKPFAGGKPFKGKRDDKPGRPDGAPKPKARKPERS
ncbi:MAG: DbpA RNA binding domain-containing protein, partial [Rhizobiales bacterium]|nr:DbpA RNA binding domain-containing protein [Hyphomicrobiales bacterium]